MAVLKNGRVLAVEYKGGHLVKEASEKARVGALWEKVSGGRSFFIMPSKQSTLPQVRGQLRAKIAKIMRAA